MTGAMREGGPKRRTGRRREDDSGDEQQKLSVPWFIRMTKRK